MVSGTMFAAVLTRVKTLEDALECQGQIMRSMSRSIANHRIILDGLVNNLGEQEDEREDPIQAAMR